MNAKKKIEEKEKKKEKAHHAPQPSPAHSTQLPWSSHPAAWPPTSMQTEKQYQEKVISESQPVNRAYANIVKLRSKIKIEILTFSWRSKQACTGFLAGQYLLTNWYFHRDRLSVCLSVCLSVSLSYPTLASALLRYFVGCVCTCMSLLTSIMCACIWYVWYSGLQTR